MSASPFVEVEGITVRFGGLTAVNGLSFKVQPGTIHALIGPNGAGKSTTFNCISRYYQPSSGTIKIDGLDVTQYKPDRMAALGVARTFQNLELFGELSVRENVLLGCHSRSARTLRGLLSRADAETTDLVDHLQRSSVVYNVTSPWTAPPQAARAPWPRSWRPISVLPIWTPARSTG